MQTTTDQAVGILREVYKECDDLKIGIQEAYLYGSYARGDYHENSDVDILLTADLSNSDLSKYRSAIASIASRLSLKYDITISITVKPLEQFQKYVNILPFYQNVMKEGIRYAN